MDSSTTPVAHYNENIRAIVINQYKTKLGLSKCFVSCYRKEHMLNS